MLKAKYVTVGYSAGAIGMIEAIRLNDKEGKILAITKENYPVYGRPAIVDYAMGKINENGIFYGGKDYSGKMQVDLRVNSEVIKINPSSHTLELSDGEKVEYEKLLLNMGGKPISPPIPGKNLEGVLNFFGLDEAKFMRKAALEGAKTAVVIGGGLIGLKATEALAHLGMKVYMVELAPTILSRALDPVASELMTKKLNECGVEVYTGVSVEEIIGDKKVSKVKLTNGKVIDTELVFISIGVTPEAKIASESGIKINKGVTIDRFMKTSAKDVFAAGDAAEGYNFVTGENMVIAIWPVARKMGFFAGLNMMDANIQYDGSIPMNSLFFDDFYTISFGDTNPQNLNQYEILEKMYPDGRSYRKFFIRDGILTAAVYVNDISRAGIAKGLIYEKIPVKSFKDHLLKKDFSYIHLPKDYRDNTYKKPFQELFAK